MKTCPRCGRETMRNREIENALSRRCNKYICSKCGMEESMEDAGLIKHRLTWSEWACNKKETN